MLASRVAQTSLRASAQQLSSLPRNAALNGLRTYAIAALDTKPLVALYGIDGTYANALVCILIPLPRHWWDPWGLRC